MRMADVAVWIDEATAAFRRSRGADVLEGYVLELLEHAGVPHRTIERLEWEDGAAPDIVIAALDDDSAAGAERLLRYAESGGIVVSYGGAAKLAGALGCAVRPTADVGYAAAPAPWDAYPRLRAFGLAPWAAPARAATGGVPAAAASGAVFAEPFGECPALLSLPVGRGWVERWAVPIPATVIALQQGREPVVKDGAPAPDGTANLDDGVLKADDGMEMDWLRDRRATPTGQPYFAHPYADYWRQVLVGHLMRTALRAGLALPCLGYWPDGVRSVAMISFDSDGNADEHAYSTLRELRECGVRSVWCMIEPGYSPAVYAEAVRDGHELALHFDAMTPGAWRRDEFRRQFDWIAGAAAPHAVVSNKNHVTRFEGWGELFEWCELVGIRADQTRGPSKAGNVGFAFGTCHPYFPIARRDQANRRYDVLEMTFLTQDMDYGTSFRADSSIIEPLLDEVEAVEGLGHFLFHQIHIHEKPPVARALRKLADSLRRRSVPVWTGQEVNAWERRRRTIRIAALDAEGQPVLDARTDPDAAKGAVVWIPQPGEHSGAGERCESRFGVPCRKVVLGDA